MRGLRYQAIGKELGITIWTVRAHVQAAKEKMQAVSVMNLVYLAIEKGLLEYPKTTLKEGLDTQY
jgi:DNA-binding NarL/FixJ family response regulator